MSRPRVAQGEHQLPSLRISEAELAYIREAARRAGQSQAEWRRRAYRAALGLPPHPRQE